MHMEALQMVLNPLQPHALRLSCLLFFVSISSSWLAFHCNEACEDFRCGNYSLDYPFGTKGSGCGDPTLQLECDNGAQMPLITIGRYQYYIMEPHYYPSTGVAPSIYPTMVILYKQFEQDACALSENVYDQFWSTAYFHFGEEYTNITCTILPSIPGYLQCNDNSYFNLTLPGFKQGCGSEFKLPVKEIDLGKPPDQIIHEGVEITWNTNAYCKDCESGYRNCSDLHTSSFCYCWTISYSQKCFDGEPNKTGTAKPDKSATGKSDKTAIILGAAIGGGVSFIAAILLVGFCRERSLASKKLQLQMAVEPSLTKMEQFLDNYAHEMPSRYSYSQLKKITNNFADKLGEGGFGIVYKGKLPRGDLVAVKILDQSRHSETQFMNEVATIGRIHHVHLVRMMGYCFDGFRNALIYEYMVNGSLEKFIFAGEKKGGILNGEQLYSIALGTARGIAYLHQDCHRRIIDFDIKPHNILLDKDFTPKIADFGLAKLCGRGDDHISMTNARGTPGYVAPEVWNRNLGSVTDKSDVYSFGMLLLEMVGGRKNIDVEVSRSSQLYLPERAFKLMQNGQLEMMLRRRGEEEIEWEDEEKAKRLAKVGLWCIQYNSIDRPSMRSVVQMLEGNGDDLSDPPLPFNSAPACQAALPFSTEDFSSMA